MGPRRATRRRPTGWLLLVILLSLAAWPASAQDAADDPAAQQRDSHDPTVPVGAVRAYIDACRRGDYASAASRLVLTGIPAAQRELQGERLARQLKFVLDQKLWIQYETISDRPEGTLDDGLPPNLEKIGTIEGDVDVPVLLERVAVPGGKREWKFAAGTVARVPALYEAHGFGALGEWLPRTFFDVAFLEVRLAQWIGLGLAVLLAWIAAWVLTRLIQALVRPIVARTRTELDDRLLALLTPPVHFLLAVGLFSAATLVLRLAQPVYRLLAGLERGAILLGLTWIALRTVDVVAELVREHLDRGGHVSARAVVPLGRRAAKAVLIALACVAVLQNLGFNVTGVLAGLGVGGLAVALAAQKTIENLFGGVSLIADQPVRVGDFCRFGNGQVGTVEEIGLRSTLVRTLDRTVVSVPNSQFSEFQLENFARRDRIRLATTLGLRYETSPDQLRYALAELRRVLLEHPRVADDPLRVRFAAFGASSLDVEIYAMVETTDFNEFCAIREDLFLRFMDVVEAAGSSFAFPSQTLYMARDGGLDRERTEASEGRVRAWRVDGELPFPDYAPDRTEAMRRRGDYPPEGSVARGNDGGTS